ncbi:aspartate-semialdehyde dehydrogenase [Aureococcus anophagefferens]|nr:aspartate-semialdehyde dehydrogenase [Aureococcus anophagefferens]
MVRGRRVPAACDSPIHGGPRREGERIPVGILGGTGLVGRALAARLLSHPIFSLGPCSVVGDRRQVAAGVWIQKGKALQDHYGAALWEAVPCPPGLREITVPRNPLIIPEANGDGCSAAIAAAQRDDPAIRSSSRGRHLRRPSLKALDATYGVVGVSVTTFQALSGRGDTGHFVDVKCQAAKPVRAASGTMSEAMKEISGLREAKVTKEGHIKPHWDVLLKWAQAQDEPKTPSTLVAGLESISSSASSQERGTSAFAAEVVLGQAAAA